MSSLQHSADFIRNSECPLPSSGLRPNPALPPLPSSTTLPSTTYASYPPYTNSYGYGGYNSYTMPYRPYGNTYGTGYGLGTYGTGYPDDAERRFIQYAEESSRQTFANVESIVRVVNSISMMLDNTFFAMTSSFRAVLSVAENFGRLRTMFGHIWYSLNVFRLFSWFYRKMMWLMGRKIPRSSTSVAWSQALNGNGGSIPSSNGFNWPTLAFFGVIISTPYLINKFLPKYEDKTNPETWKTPGMKVRAAYNFVARNSNELSIQKDDEVTLAPPDVQESLGFRNTYWAFAVCNGKSGIVPLNYLTNADKKTSIPVPRNKTSNLSNPIPKTHTKRVSFGENQIFPLEENYNEKKNEDTDQTKESNEVANVETIETSCEKDDK